MTTEFEYHYRGRQRGWLHMVDSVGPLTLVLREGELALTYLAGFCQAGGATALYVRQEVDAIVKYQHVAGADHAEGLLAGWIAWVPCPEGSDLRDVLRALLADYLN